MKVFVYILVILVSGLLGYGLYPKVSETFVRAGWIEKVVKIPKESRNQSLAEDGGKGERKAPEPAVEPAPEPKAPPVTDPSVAQNPEPAPAPEPAAGATPPELTGLSPDRLPEKILIKDSVTVFDPGSDLKMEIPVGQRIKPVRIDGAEVVVSPADPFVGRIAVVKTDLIEQLRAMPPAPKPVPTPPPVVAQNPKPAPVPEPEPAPAPEPKPEPPPVVGTGSPSPVPPPVQPGGAQPEPANGAGDLAGIIAVMKDSIRSGEVKEFTYDQVLGWKGVGEEEIDGESYLTGLVAYKAETIFGVKTIQAKALIKDGKVAKWIWPKSGMEIK